IRDQIFRGMRGYGYRPGLLLGLVLLLTFVPGVQPVWADVENELSVSDAQDSEWRLLAQIRLGEALYRDDVVYDAVARLYRLRKNHPQGLLAELRIATRLSRLGDAEHLLERLQEVAPTSPEAHTGYILLKLTTPDA